MNTAFVIALATVVIALLAIAIVRYGDSLDVTPPVRPPQVTRLVVAGNYAQACSWAHEFNWDSGSWRYVDRVEQLYGYNAGDVKIELLGEYARSVIWDDPASITRLRMLGLGVFDPYELVPDGILPS